MLRTQSVVVVLRRRWRRRLRRRRRRLVRRSPLLWIASSWVFPLHSRVSPSQLSIIIIKSRAEGFTPLTLGSQWVRQYPVSGVPGVGCHHTVQGLGSSSRCGIGVSRKTMRGGTWLSISPRWSPVLGPFLYLSVRESYSDNISTVRSCKSNSHILPRARQNGIRPLSTAESFVYDFRTSRGVVRVSSPYPPRDERLRLPLNH